MFRYTSLLQVILRTTTIVVLLLCVSVANAQDKNSPSTKAEPVLLTPDNVVKVKGLKGEQSETYSTGKTDNVDSKLSKPKSCKSGVGVTQTQKGQVVLTRNAKALIVKETPAKNTPPAIGVEGDPAFWNSTGTDWGNPPTKPETTVTEEDVKKMPQRKAVPVANHKPIK